MLLWNLHFLLAEQTNCLLSEFSRQFISDLNLKIYLSNIWKTILNIFIYYIDQHQVLLNLLNLLRIVGSIFGLDWAHRLQVHHIGLVLNGKIRIRVILCKQIFHCPLLVKKHLKGYSLAKEKIRIGNLNLKNTIYVYLW